MSSRVSSRRIAAVCLGLLFAVGACSATTSDGFSNDGTGTNPTPTGTGTSTGPTSDGGTTTPSCTPDPTCGREACLCPSGSRFATNGICRVAGECDSTTACTAACGETTTAGLLYKACTSPLDCFTAEPNVSCACQLGAGYMANEVCKDNLCSGAPEDVCPSACSSEDGWQGCASDDDCATLFCGCKDGKIPVIAGSCGGIGMCAPASTACTSACSSHGGYTGGSTTNPPDGGTTTGPKNPGDPCTKSTECKAFDCKCKDGSDFTGNQDCDGISCATQAATCGLACLSSGGWSGT